MSLSEKVPGALPWHKQTSQHKQDTTTVLKI